MTLPEQSAIEGVSASLAALRRVDDATGAVASFNDDRALADAARLDRSRSAGLPGGPLRGVPVTVKDWIVVEGFPCLGESEAERDRWPDTDATAIDVTRRYWRRSDLTGLEIERQLVP